MEDKDEKLSAHLEALRAVLIRCFTALGLAFIPLFLAAPYAIDILIKLLIGNHDIALNYFSPMEVFILQIKVAAVLDILLCFPYMAYQIWQFVLPALYDNERKLIRSIVLSSASLFIFGVLFCLFFILPLIINFGLSFANDNLKAVLGISNIVSLSLWLSIIFGVMFQFPLVTYSLIKSKIVSYQSVKDKRPYVFVIILIIAAVLTPPDIVSQLMLAVPTYLLFEIGLYFSRKI